MSGRTILDLAAVLVLLAPALWLLRMSDHAPIEPEHAVVPVDVEAIEDAIVRIDFYLWATEEPVAR